MNALPALVLKASFYLIHLSIPPSTDIFYFVSGSSTFVSWRRWFTVVFNVLDRFYFSSRRVCAHVHASLGFPLVRSTGLLRCVILRGTPAGERSFGHLHEKRDQNLVSIRANAL